MKLAVLCFVFISLLGCSDKNELLLEALKKKDHIAAKRLLLEHELDVHSRDRYGYTPLHLSESEELSRLLIAQGANPNARGGGADPGMKPIKNVDLGKLGSFDMNELKRGKDYSPLHTVESHRAAEVLIEGGADVNALANYKVTPLHRAAARKDGFNLARLLLNKGAKVNARTNYNTTPLHEAMFYAGNNDMDVVKLLLAHGADVNAQDNLGHTPLHGVRGGDVALAEYLVEHGADVTLASKDGDLPICYAIADNKIDLMHFYIVRGDGILSRCSNGRGLLTYAKEKANAKTAEAVKKATVLILKEFQRGTQGGE